MDKIGLIFLGSIGASWILHGIWSLFSGRLQYIRVFNPSSPSKRIEVVRYVDRSQSPRLFWSKWIFHAVFSLVFVAFGVMWWISGK